MVRGAVGHGRTGALDRRSYVAHGPWGGADLPGPTLQPALVCEIRGCSLRARRDRQSYLPEHDQRSLTRGLGCPGRHVPKRREYRCQYARQCHHSYCLGTLAGNPPGLFLTPGPEIVPKPCFACQPARLCRRHARHAA